MFAELDKSSPLQKIQKILPCAKSNSRIQHWFFSKMSHLQVVCEIQNQRQEVYSVYVDLNFFQLHVRQANCSVYSSDEPRRSTFGWISSSSILGVCLGNIIQ